MIVRLGFTAGLRNGLSRMRGNHQVRFLGEDAVERPHPYPTQPACSVHQDQRLEDFSRMHDRHRKGAHGDDIDADDAMFGIEPADQELFAIQTLKERSEQIRRADRGQERGRRPGRPTVPHQRDAIAGDRIGLPGFGCRRRFTLPCEP